MSHTAIQSTTTRPTADCVEGYWVDLDFDAHQAVTDSHSLYAAYVALMQRSPPCRAAASTSAAARIYADSLALPF